MCGGFSGRSGPRRRQQAFDACAWAYGVSQYAREPGRTQRSGVDPPGMPRPPVEDPRGKRVGRHAEESPAPLCQRTYEMLH
jgi:hypothetical protein